MPEIRLLESVGRRHRDRIRKDLLGPLVSVLVKTVLRHQILQAIASKIQSNYWRVVTDTESETRPLALVVLKLDSGMSFFRPLPQIRLLESGRLGVCNNPTFVVSFLKGVRRISD